MPAFDAPFTGGSFQIGGNPTGFLDRIRNLGAPPVVPGSLVPGGKAVQPPAIPGTPQGGGGGAGTPAGAPGSGVVPPPGAGTPKPTAPGALPNAPLRPDANPFAFPDLLAALEAMFPGLQLGAPGQTGIDPGQRNNLINVLSGPVFSNDPFGLPGKGGGIGAGLNLILQQIAQQGGRSKEAEALLRGLANMLGTSAPAQVSDANVARAGALSDPSALDALIERRMNALRSDVARGLNDDVNRLRDLGVVGQGASSRDALLQAGNLAGERLRRGSLDIANQGERDRLNRLGLSQQIAGSGADVTRALRRDPVLQLVDTLRRAENPAVGPLIEALLQTGNLQIGEALATRGGSFFEEAAPLLGDLLGAAGKAGAAAA